MIPQLAVSVEVIRIVRFRRLVLHAVEIQDVQRIIKIGKTPDVIIIWMGRDKASYALAPGFGLDLLDDVVFVVIGHAAIDDREIVAAMLDIEHVAIADRE